MPEYSFEEQAFVMNGMEVCIIQWFRPSTKYPYSWFISSLLLSCCNIRAIVLFPTSL